MSSDEDEEDLEYFRARMFAMLTVPKDCGHTNKPIWRGDLDEDYYIARWGELRTESFIKVFPDAELMEEEEEGAQGAYFFRDAVGNRQFVIESDDSTVSSHGSHILSPAQYARLNNAGAEFY